MDNFSGDEILSFNQSDPSLLGSYPQLVDSFNRDNSLFGMLLTTKTGGVGLVRTIPIIFCQGQLECHATNYISSCLIHHKQNLIGANRVVLFDPGKSTILLFPNEIHLNTKLSFICCCRLESSIRCASPRACLEIWPKESSDCLPSYYCW